MSNEKGLNERGNHQAEFSQGVGGWAEYTVYMTDTSDTVRHDIKVPPGQGHTRHLFARSYGQ